MIAPPKNPGTYRYVTRLGTPCNVTLVDGHYIFRTMTGSHMFTLPFIPNDMQGSWHGPVADGVVHDAMPEASDV